MTVEKWHVEKKVNVGHIITTVAIAASAIIAFSAQNERISLNEQRIAYLEAQRDEDRQRFEKRLDKIDTKLDRLLDRVTK